MIEISILLNSNYQRSGEHSSSTLPTRLLCFALSTPPMLASPSPLSFPFDFILLLDSLFAGLRPPESPLSLEGHNRRNGRRSPPSPSLNSPHSLTEISAFLSFKLLFSSFQSPVPLSRHEDPLAWPCPALSCLPQAILLISQRFYGVSLILKGFWSRGSQD